MTAIKYAFYMLWIRSTQIPRKPCHRGPKTEFEIQSTQSSIDWELSGKYWGSLNLDRSTCIDICSFNFSWAVPWLFLRLQYYPLFANFKVFFNRLETMTQVYEKCVCLRICKFTNMTHTIGTWKWSPKQVKTQYYRKDKAGRHYDYKLDKSKSTYLFNQSNCKSWPIETQAKLNLNFFSQPLVRVLMDLMYI